MTRTDVKVMLDRARELVSEVCHDPDYGQGGTHPGVSERCQIAQMLLASAWTLASEGEGALTPSPEQHLRFYRAIQTMQEHVVCA